MIKWFLFTMTLNVLSLSPAFCMDRDEDSQSTGRVLFERAKTRIFVGDIKYNAARTRYEDYYAQEPHFGYSHYDQEPHLGYLKNVIPLLKEANRLGVIEANDLLLDVYLRLVQEHVKYARHACNLQEEINSKGP